MSVRFVSTSAVFAPFLPRLAPVLFIETNAPPSMYAPPTMQPCLMMIDWPPPASVICR